MMNTAEIEGYFTNHSARQTESTWLSQAGVEKKLAKQMTGHRSDAVDKYQITSVDQRRQKPNILTSR